MVIIMVLYSTYLKKDNKLIIAVSYVEGGFTHILFITNPKYDSIQPGEIITGDYAIEIFSSEPIPYEEFESFVDELNKKFFLLTTKIKIKEWISDIKDPYHLPFSFESLTL